MSNTVKLFRALVTLWGMIWFLIYLVIAAIPSMVLYLIPYEKHIPFTRKLMWLYAFILLRISSFSRPVVIDRRTEKYPCSLFISNHQSFMDIPLVMAYHQLATLMKKEVYNVPIMGQMAVHGGAVVVDRKNKESRKQSLLTCISRLKKGISLHYYPEGTRSKTATPKPLEKIHTPIMEAAYDMGIPVTPLSLYGTERIGQKTFIINPFQKVYMITHDNILPRDFDSKEAFLEACWTKVVEGHHELSVVAKEDAKQEGLRASWT